MTNKDTNADFESRKQSVKNMLRDDVNSSNRAIGRHCHVSPNVVKRVRDAMVEAGEIIQSNIRTVKDRSGHVYKMSVSREPKKRSNKRIKHRFGIPTADQAIRLLDTIQKTDIEREEGLKRVCDWLRAQNACQCIERTNEEPESKKEETNEDPKDPQSKTR